ncbi:hypothetical protein EYF80_056466 [Liparis tanakae]|uniref:Uncharacterized protein n=1 Tax=Liparis tanakae TaxID=230148 RepID=A0A4Z2EXN2_9TELE|nr:hypothetical protein EYF80_056466 [Liparis tanakae]
MDVTVLRRREAASHWSADGVRPSRPMRGREMTQHFPMRGFPLSQLTNQVYPVGQVCDDVRASLRH